MKKNQILDLHTKSTNMEPKSTSFIGSIGSIGPIDVYINHM